MTSYENGIQPYVKDELRQYRELLAKGEPVRAFEYLENAHVLGQPSTRLHVLAHFHMARWAVSQKDAKEFLGQIFRIIGAASKTALGFIPTGNTGGANVSPFKPMLLSAEHERLIARASA